MRFRHADGFSIVEVLIAAAIFVTAVATLIQLLSASIDANAAARFRTEATMLARTKVEELLAVPWGSEASAADSPLGFARTWVVRPLAERPDAALTIDVQVAHARIETVRLLAVKLRHER